MRKTKHYQNPFPSVHRVASPESAVSRIDPQRPLITFRPYQAKAFHNRTDGIQVWLWGRQTGKSFTLAAWAVDRLITNPGRTVTVLSNSKFNGAELNLKCAEICRVMGQAFEQVDMSPDDKFDTMRFETRVHLNGQTGRILILAANPLTARSFSGDLILDEFAFHENSVEIWKAASPILDSNPDYLCRIASTPNGKHNEFYRKATDPTIPLIKVTRTDAFHQGCAIYHPVTRKAITPEEARALAPNKRDYDQNYECVFEDENMALLTHELINAAERPEVGFVCDDQWSREAIEALKTQFGCSTQTKTATQWIREAVDEEAMRRHLLEKVCNGSADRFDDLLHSKVEIDIREMYDPKRNRQCELGRNFFVGVDVGRNHDRTVITVVERSGSSYQVRALLRLGEMRLPEQQQRLEDILRIPGVRACKIDMTGLGLGLYEYTQNVFPNVVQGVNFSSSTAASAVVTAPRVRITEHLATRLLQCFEDRTIQMPIDAHLRDDLRKPERLVSASGRVCIAAARDEAGHADHFWSLALAIDAAKSPQPQPFTYYSWLPKARRRVARL